jgi:GNAT superfamily N-acetyltransferase
MTSYQLRLATQDDVPAVIGLFDRAAAWLRAKGTRQWARPWPDLAGRDARIAQGVQRGHTWLLENGTVPAGTVTFSRQGNENGQELWRPGELLEPAAYLGRLIVDRPFAGQGTGARLIDWVGQRASTGWGARWIRIDVWSDNDDLHAYYKRQGFHYLRTCEFEDPWKYPSGALFQKPVGEAGPAAAACFRVRDQLL